MVEIARGTDGLSTHFRQGGCKVAETEVAGIEKNGEPRRMLLRARTRFIVQVSYFPIDWWSLSCGFRSTEGHGKLYCFLLECIDYVFVFLFKAIGWGTNLIRLLTLDQMMDHQYRTEGSLD